MSLYHPDRNERRTDLTGITVRGPLQGSTEQPWRFQTWHLTADQPDDLTGLQLRVSDQPGRIRIGRIRTKTLTTNQPEHIDDAGLKPAFCDQSNQLNPTLGTGLTEILNIELDPALEGQGHGPRLVGAALTEVPATDLIVCVPAPTYYANRTKEQSDAAVDKFWRSLGLQEMRALPGYLGATAGDILTT